MTILQDWSLMNLSYSTSLHICMPVFFILWNTIFSGAFLQNGRKRKGNSASTMYKNIYMYIVYIHQLLYFEGKH